MSKAIPGSFKKISSDLSICECERDSERPRGFWIYDEIAGMNLAMGEPDRDKAFALAIAYWQRRSARAEQAYNELQSKVDFFVQQFVPADAFDRGD